MKWPPTPSFFFNRRQFLLLHKRCNHHSDGIFQILSRNLLAVSGDAAQLIFTTHGHLAQHYQNWLLVYNNTKIQLHILAFVMKIWCKFLQIGCIFRGCSGCLPEGVLTLTNLVSIDSEFKD
jgi:hypothetical protein